MAYAVKDGALYDTKYYESGTLVAHTFVKLGTAATQFQAIAHATNDRPYGVLEEVTANKALPMKLIVFGPAKVVAGSAGFTAGKMVCIDATGKVVDATPTYGTEQIVGWAEESAADGDLGTIFVCKILAAGS